MGGSARTRVEWTWVMRPTDQGTAVGFFVICWLGLLVYVCHGGLSELTEEPPVADPRRGDERVATPLVSFEVDVNRADWPEWALLPGVGETLARRIVEHRLRVGGFATVDEVARVRGIGPKTLVRLRPYLVRREDFPVPPTPQPPKRPPWNSNSPVNSLRRATSLKRSRPCPRPWRRGGSIKFCWASQVRARRSRWPTSSKT